MNRGSIVLSVERYGSSVDGIAMHEIEDAVLPGIESRDECRPCHRTLRRVGGREMRVTASVAQLREVRQIRPVPLDERRVHAVDADHDHFFVMACCRMPLAARAARLTDSIHAAAMTDLPSIHAGASTPKRLSAVGAMSSMPGSSA